MRKDYYLQFFETVTTRGRFMLISINGVYFIFAWVFIVGFDL